MIFKIRAKISIFWECRRQKAEYRIEVKGEVTIEVKEGVKGDVTIEVKEGVKGDVTIEVKGEVKTILVSRVFFSRRQNTEVRMAKPCNVVARHDTTNTLQFLT